MSANGEPHQRLVTSEEERSSTMSLDTLLTSLIIGAFEKRKVSMIVTPRSCLQTDVPRKKCVLLNLEGRVAEIMCEENPQYSLVTSVYRNQKALHLQAKKVVHGMIEQVLLWHDSRASSLIGMVFELNACDPCVAKK